MYVNKDETDYHVCRLNKSKFSDHVFIVESCDRLRRYINNTHHTDKMSCLQQQDNENNNLHALTGDWLQCLSHVLKMSWKVATILVGLGQDSRSVILIGDKVDSSSIKNNNKRSR